MDLEKRVDDLEHKSTVMFDKLDMVRNTANEALTLARHASKGYIELAVEIRSLKSDVEEVKIAQKEFKQDIEKLGNQISGNLKWTVLLIFTMLSVFYVLIK